MISADNKYGWYGLMNWIVVYRMIILNVIVGMRALWQSCLTWPGLMLEMITFEILNADMRVGWWLLSPVRSECLVTAGDPRWCNLTTQSPALSCCLFGNLMTINKTLSDSSSLRMLNIFPSSQHYKQGRGHWIKLTPTGWCFSHGKVLVLNAHCLVKCSRADHILKERVCRCICTIKLMSLMCLCWWWWVTTTIRLAGQFCLPGTRLPFCKLRVLMPISPVVQWLRGGG